MRINSLFWKFSLLACCLVASNALAQSGPMVHVGVGVKSCGEWLTLYEKQKPSEIDSLQKAMLISWVQGYLVGAAEAMSTLLGGPKPLSFEASREKFNTLSGWAFDPPDSEAVKHWVSKYCRENPLEYLTSASLGLTAELFTRK